MAYTSIIPVHRLDNSIDYVRDRNKTTKKPEQAGSLEEAIAYAMNREKTETAVFEDGIGCTCMTAFGDMVATKKRFHKTGGVQGYHLIQSFAVREVTPELAHLIGLELSEQLLKGQFEAVITTHLNTSHYHNHIVFNSVSMEDGHKYHSNSRSYYEDVRRISDSLCRKYGLSVIQTNGKGMSYAQWQAEKNEKPTWRTGIRMDIREAVQMSFTWKQFLYQMETKGYEWKLGRKYISLKAPGMERYVRLKSLGKNYTEEAIRVWILQPEQRQPERLQQPDGNGGRKKPRKKATGLQALYYVYMYRLGIWGRKPSRYSYSLRADIRKLDQRIEQLDFLQKHGITTREELKAYRKPLEEKMLELMKERRGLYRSAPGCERIGEIAEELKPIRKAVQMCSRIEVHSLEIEHRLKQMEAWEKEYLQQKAETENKKETKKER